SSAEPVAMSQSDHAMYVMGVSALASFHPSRSFGPTNSSAHSARTVPMTSPKTPNQAGVTLLWTTAAPSGRSKRVSVRTQVFPDGDAEVAIEGLEDDVESVVLTSVSATTRARYGTRNGNPRTRYAWAESQDGTAVRHPAGGAAAGPTA